MLKTISPKVFAAAVGAVLLGGLVAALGSVTLPMLSFLGSFAPVALTFLTVVGTGLGALVSGYWITDPIRQAGESALAVHDSIAAAAPLQGTEVTAAAKSAEFDHIVAPPAAAVTAPEATTEPASVVVPLDRPAEPVAAAPVVSVSA